jgi:hypothetical protein
MQRRTNEIRSKTPKGWGSWKILGARVAEFREKQIPDSPAHALP